MVEAGGLTEREDTIVVDAWVFIAILCYSPPKRSKTRFRGVVQASRIVLETYYLRILRLSLVSGLVIKNNYSGSQESEVYPMPYALCPMPDSTSCY